MPPPPLSFTRFMFIVPREDDEAFRMRLRAAGRAVARGFFNDYDAEGSRDSPHEAIAFFVAEGEPYPDSAIAAAPFVVQVSGKYRPRLGEVDAELRRRIGDAAGVLGLEGIERVPRYTSAELHEFAYAQAAARRPGRRATHAVILPMAKTAAWWSMPPLERQVFFYPHTDAATGLAVPGHARAAAEGIGTLFRRVYYHPQGSGGAHAYDFIAYFECAQTELATFARVHRALRDTAQNPEWRYVIEGPLWIGRRVLKW